MKPCFCHSYQAVSSCCFSPFSSTSCVCFGTMSSPEAASGRVTGPGPICKITSNEVAHEIDVVVCSRAQCIIQAVCGRLWLGSAGAAVQWWFKSCAHYMIQGKTTGSTARQVIPSLNLTLKGKRVWLVHGSECIHHMCWSMTNRAVGWCVRRYVRKAQIKPNKVSICKAKGLSNHISSSLLSSLTARWGVCLPHHQRPVAGSDFHLMGESERRDSEEKMEKAEQNQIPENGGIVYCT